MPQDWLDSIQEFISTMASPQFVVTLASTTSVQVVAGTDNNQVSIGINGKWRYNTATATAAHPGGGAGTYDIWVLGSANVFTPGGLSGEVDTTDYSFGLKIQAGGSSAPTGTYNGHAITLTRKVATLAWDGTKITSLTMIVGAASTPAHQFSATIGDGSAKSIAVAHGLNTQDVIVQVHGQGAPFAVVLPDIQITDVNTVTLLFAVAPANNAYRVVVVT